VARIIKLMALAIFSMQLAGCSYVPPSCDDPQVGELMKGFIFNSLRKTFHQLGAGDADYVIAKAEERMSISLSSVRTDGFDIAARKYSCKAVVSIIIPDNSPSYSEGLLKVRNNQWQRSNGNVALTMMNAMISAELMKAAIDGSAIHASAQYTIQSVDDGDYYVEVDGVDPIVSGLYALAMTGAFAEKVSRESGNRGGIDAQTNSQVASLSGNQTASHVGQCVYPKTKSIGNGKLEFLKPINVYKTPSTSSAFYRLETMEAFTVGAESSGGFVQLIGTSGWDESENESSGKVIGWALLSDFEFQELRNCN